MEYQNNYELFIANSLYKIILNFISLFVYYLLNIDLMYENSLIIYDLSLQTLIFYFNLNEQNKKNI